MNIILRLLNRLWPSKGQRSLSPEVPVIEVNFMDPLQLPKRFVSVDIETTGLVPEKAEVIEIGAVRFDSGVIVDQFETLVRPSSRVPREISKLTGITTEMVQTARTPSEALQSFVTYIRDEPLIAHNASFEASFFKEHLRRQGISGHLNFICTCRLARSTLSLPNYRLATVSGHFGIAMPTAHRAIPDAVAAGHVMNRITVDLETAEARRRDQRQKEIEEAKRREARREEKRAQLEQKERRRQDENDAIDALRTMLSDVCSDGELTYEECERVSGWLSLDGSILGKRPYSTLRNRLLRALEDGKLTSSEISRIRESIDQIVSGTSVPAAN